MTRWFGPSWLAPVCDPENKVETPLGEICAWCEEDVVEGDQGLILEDDKCWHKECFLRSVLGSVGHQRKRCSCFGGKEEDPVELTVREAAIAAVKEFTS